MNALDVCMKYPCPYDVCCELPNVENKQDSFEITSDDRDGQYDFICTLILGTIIKYGNVYEYLKYMVEERKLKQ